MTKTARVYTIESLIRARGHVSFAQLLEVLAGCTRYFTSGSPIQATS